MKGDLGVVTNLLKSDDNTSIIAEVSLANGSIISMKVGGDVSVGDYFNVNVTPNGVKLEPTAIYDKNTSYSVRFGAIDSKDLESTSPFSIYEVGDKTRIGTQEGGHCSSSNKAVMVGHGITNYQYFDEIGGVTKILHSSGIEGNMIFGSSLEDGLSIRFYIEQVKDPDALEISPDDFLKSLQSASVNEFLINTIGTQGMLFSTISSIYKIEGSGNSTLSEFLSIQDFNVSDKTFKTNLSPLYNKIVDNLSILDTTDFVIHISEIEDNNSGLGKANSGSASKNKVDDKIIKIVLFGTEYKVNEIKINSKGNIYHYVDNLLYENNSYKIIAKDLILRVDNLVFEKGIFINPGNNNLFILNDKLTINALEIDYNLDSLKAFAKDEIKLQVGGKGIKIDYTGSSNL